MFTTTPDLTEVGTKSENDSKAFVDTKLLSSVSQWLLRHQEVAEMIGKVARFRVVVDANYVISDLIQRVRYPDRGNRALIELAIASVVEVYAPAWLEEEILSTIPRVAKKRRLASGALLSEWQEYQKHIKWCDPPTSEVEAITAGDSKDAPYIALERFLSADGVLSDDRDIDRMSGRRLTVSFVLSVRGYARSNVVALTISIGGHLASAAAVATVITLLRAIGKQFQRIPDPVKLVFVVALTIALVNPTSRAWLKRQLSTLLSTLTPTASGLLEIISQGIEHVREQKLAAADELAKAKAFVSSASGRASQ